MYILLLLSTLDDDERTKLEKLYDHYKNLMMYIALDILKNKELAEEAVQESMISLIKVVNDIEEIKSKKTYGLIIIVTKRCAFNKLKYENRRKHASVEILEYTPMSGKSIDEIVIDKISCEDILSKMKTIREEDKNIILLKYYFGYSYKEIARYIDMKETTVRKRCERAKRLIINKTIDRGDDK